MINKVYKIALLSVLLGLGFASLHPLAHALNDGFNNHSSSRQQSQIVHQTLDEITFLNSCYVCIFSKILTPDGKSTLNGFNIAVIESTISFPSFGYKHKLDRAILLRGPPSFFK